MADLEGARKQGTFKVISCCPDVCKTPSDGKAVPYSISGDFKDSIRYSPDVNFIKNPAMTMNSRVSKVTGNEAGSLGGIKSGVNTDHCRPIMASPSVRVNGYNVLYKQSTYMWMNCAGPDGPGNTIGKVIYSGPNGFVQMNPDGPLADCDPVVLCEIPAEYDFLDLLDPSSFLKNLTSSAGITSLAQMAPSLAMADWSNPGSILSAAGGLAGAGGLGAVAKAAGLGAQAYSISQSGLSNPGAILGAASTLAGMGGLKANNPDPNDIVVKTF